MNPELCLRTPASSGKTRREGFAAELPSLLFIVAVIANTALIVAVPSTWLRVPLALVQALLLIGCQEAKHLSVHRTFLGHKLANDAAGIFCAALFGVNFIAYRHFHFRHHRATCTDDDPEGRLYLLLTMPTRWLWAIAPVEQPFISFYINRVAWPLVPPGQFAARRLATAWMIVFALSVGLLAWRHPQAVLWAYAIPLALFSWIDFPLTQAEHYGVGITSPSQDSRPQGDIAHDVVFPLGLGWLTLHRALHRVHHRHPRLRWFEAPAALRADATAAPVSYLGFARRWFVGGPRIWRAETPEQATPATP